MWHKNKFPPFNFAFNHRLVAREIEKKKKKHMKHYNNSNNDDGNAFARCTITTNKKITQQYSRAPFWLIFLIIIIVFYKSEPQWIIFFPLCEWEKVTKGASAVSKAKNSFFSIFHRRKKVKSALFGGWWKAAFSFYIWRDEESWSRLIYVVFFILYAKC